MNQPNKQYLWLAGFLMVIFSLFMGALVGGIAGYMITSSWNAPGQGQIASSVSDLDPTVSQVNATASANVSGSQSLVITEESAGVEAVETVLPAVVTVLTSSGFGGGSGSGFFISQDGYVVTNNHVIEGAQNIAVVYAEGGQASAQLIGTAPEFDLAVLKVDGPVPAIVSWGDSGELPLGSTVIAIGSALGQYQNTVTAGILSGFNRQLAGMNGLLQTDAAINQGNSGGPLVNLGGQVIGINTLVARGSGEVQGLGFAIPSNVARTVVRHLIESGSARHPFMGIQYQALNPQLATESGLNINEGALLESIIDGTPAARAGLRAGDVIVAINGQAVDDRHPLVSLLLEHVAGDTITIKISRDGTTFETDLTLGERA